MFTLKIVVWTDLLHKLVVDAEKGDEDADNFEGLGTKPGSIGLGVFSETGLRRIIQTRFGLLGTVGLLILDTTVKGLDVFGIDG